MEYSPKGWRACYRHPKKPASRDCAECGKPICGDCIKESGDPALCPACNEAVTSGDKAAAAPLIEPPRSERTPLSVGEVTIHDDGRVEALQKVEGKAEVPRDDTPPTTDEEERLMAGVPQKESSPKPIVKRPIPGEVGPTGAKTASTIKQLAAALPYGLMAGICVIGFWLIIASIWHSWTQTAIFTMGIAVPWALTRGSTVRKRMGVRVWKRPPHPIWIGLLSTGIMLPLIPLTEFLAYKIVLRGSDLVSPGSKFMSLYFNAIGIILIVSGFVLAFGIPYVLRIGEGWRAPAVPRRFWMRIAKVFKVTNRRAAK